MKVYYGFTNKDSIINFSKTLSNVSWVRGKQSSYTRIFCNAFKTYGIDTAIAVRDGRLQYGNINYYKKWWDVEFIQVNSEK